MTQPHQVEAYRRILPEDGDFIIVFGWQCIDCDEIDENPEWTVEDAIARAATHGVVIDPLPEQLYPYVCGEEECRTETQYLTISDMRDHWHAHRYTHLTTAELWTEMNT